jgi:hypothetical protein
MNRRNISRRVLRCRSAVRLETRKRRSQKNRPEPNAKDSATDHAADSGLIPAARGACDIFHRRFAERIGLADALALGKFDALLSNRRLVQRFSDD